MARLGWGVVAGAVAALAAGCSDEEWVYRPRRDAAVMDLGVVVDGAVGDRGVAGDDGMTSTGDAGVGSDADVGTDGGVVATGLMLQVQGIATASGESLAAGTLELSETGFEVGQPGCVGALCLTGGLVP